MIFKKNFSYFPFNKTKIFYFLLSIILFTLINMNNCSKNNSKPCDICTNNCENCLNKGNFLTNKNPGIYSNCPNFCSSCYIDKNKFLMCDKCFNGNFLKNFQCLPCDEKCYSCKEKSDNCQKCAKGFYAKKSNEKPNDLKCLKCKESCSKCLNEEKCTECAKGFKKINADNENKLTLIQNFLKEKYLNSKKFNFIEKNPKEFICIKDIKCPKNEYYNHILDKCLPCDKSCKSCKDLGTNCIECSQNFAKINNTNKCFDKFKIPKGYFFNLIKNQFEPCSENCLKCENNKKCEKCLNSFYLDEFHKCNKCNHKCQSCEMNPLNCTSCKPQFFKIFKENKCLDKCPAENYYIQSITINGNVNNVCRKCAKYCAICNGPEKCESCINGLSLLKKTGECKLICPNGFFAFYENDENKLNDFKCLKCDPSCSTCDIKENNCISCGKDFYKLEDFFHKNYFNCYNKCPIGYYLGYSDEIELNNSNKNTKISNKILIEKSSLNLLVKLQKGKKINEKEKTNSKTKKHKLDFEGFDLKGKINPKNLKENNSICLKPQKLNFLQFTKSKNIKNFKEKICRKCSKYCEVCDYPGETCNKCQKNYYLLIPEKICINKCEKEKGLFINENKCERCDPTCKTCEKSAFNCIECETNFAKIYQKDKDKEKENKKGIENLNNFEQLNPKEEYLLHSYIVFHKNLNINKPIVKNILNKYDICFSNTIEIKGFFFNKNKNIFEKCDKSCKECTNQSNNCLICEKGFFNLIDDKKKSKCFQICPLGYYLNKTANQCELCDESCLECFQKSDNCVKCSIGFFKVFKSEKCLKYSLYEILFEKFVGENSNKIEKGYINRGDFENNFNKEKIKENENGNSGIILKEGNKKFDNDNNNISEINLKQPENISLKISEYYFDNLSNSFKPCALFCFGCVNNESNCLACNKGYVRSLTEPYICIKSCEKGYYMSIFGCLKCSEKCAECEFNKNNCTKCKKEFYHLPKRIHNTEKEFDCVRKCPLDYFEDSTNFKCKKCNISCSQCKKSKDICSVCNKKDGYLPLEDNFTKCLIDNPIGYWKNTAKNVYSKCAENCEICINDKKCVSCANNSFNKFFPFSDFIYNNKKFDYLFKKENKEHTNTNYFIKFFDKISQLINSFEQSNLLTNEEKNKLIKQEILNIDYIANLIIFHTNENSFCVISCPLGFFSNKNSKIVHNNFPSKFLKENKMIKNFYDPKEENEEINYNNNELLKSFILFKKFLNKKDYMKIFEDIFPKGKENNFNIFNLIFKFNKDFIKQNICFKCDKSCSECKEDSYNCIKCNIKSGYVPIVELNKDEYLSFKDKFPGEFITNNCFLENECPKGFFLNEDFSSEKSKNEKEKISTKTLTEINNDKNLSDKNFNKLNNSQIDLMTNKKCDFCSNSCLTCIENKNNCKECNKNYFPLEDNRSKCYKICPNGYYLKEFSDEKICLKCDKSCENCESFGKCSTCAKGYKNSIIDKRICISEKCDDGFYYDDDEKECRKCDEKCSLCIENSSKCLSCNYLSGYFEKEKTKEITFINWNQKKSKFVECINKDDNSISLKGYYLDLNEKRFRIYDEKFETCDINNKKKDTNKSPINIFNSRKLKIKSDMNTKNTTINITDKNNQESETGKKPISTSNSNCDISCKTCTEPQKCIECNRQLNYFPMKDDSTKCFTHPPNGYFFDQKNEKYEKCFAGCDKCFNKFDNCIGCNIKEDYYPLIDKLTTCTKFCPEGYKFDSKRAICDIDFSLRPLNLTSFSKKNKANYLFLSKSYFICYMLFLILFV